MVPNDFFKRPGPHHAYEVDLAKLAQLRIALDPVEELGYADPLAQLLDWPPERVLDPCELSTVYSHCLVDPGDDFGLTTYGPMLERAGFSLAFGEPLFQQRNPREHPISPFWSEAAPWLPQRVAPASEILAAVPELLAPPSDVWDTLLEEMVDPDADDEAADEIPEEERPPALIARWRTEYGPEVEGFARRLREIAEHSGWVVTWSSEQGWL